MSRVTAGASRRLLPRQNVLCDLLGRADDLLGFCGHRLIVDLIIRLTDKL